MVAGSGAEALFPLPSLEQILAAVGPFATFGFPEARCEPAGVKARYRQLALRVHPDKCEHPRANEAFQRLSQAFEVLGSTAAQERLLREAARAAAAPCGRGSRRAGGAAGGAGAKATPGDNKAWWDTKTWDEFDRRFKRREEIEAMLKAKYMSHMQGKYFHRRLRRQVLDAERSCEHLDRAKGVTDSELWPPEFREFPNKAEMQVAAFEGARTEWDEMLERGELDSSEYCASRLVDLLTHLRTVHVYCLHCGCPFEDGEDLERSCPGVDEEAHETADNMAMRADTGPAAGVIRELAPPPKRQRPRPPPPPDDDEDDAFAALLARGVGAKRGGRGAPRAAALPTAGLVRLGGFQAACLTSVGHPRPRGPGAMPPSG